jgi:hypothetical protein
MEHDRCGDDLCRLINGPYARWDRSEVFKARKRIEHIPK